jgi:hypothetical protein
MKQKLTTVLVMTAFILSFVISPVTLMASDSDSSIMINHDINILDSYSGNRYIAAIEKKEIVDPVENTSSDDNGYEFSLHKVLGWTTLGLIGATVGAVGFGSKDIHCALARTTTGFAVATTTVGIYQYGGLISLTDGDWAYNTHALLATLATAGFITTIILAPDGGHPAIGIASASAFTVAIGIIYF